MRPPRRGAGDPAEICAPALPAVPRPCALAPSLALHSRTACTQAPRHAVPVRLQSHRPESGPRRRMRCLQGPRQGYLRGADAHSQTGLSEATPRGSSSRPCGERDVDRRRVDPGEAPKLESVFWLRPCPLPAALRWEEHPLTQAPLPASSAVKSRHAATGGAGDRPPLVPG